MNRRVTAIIVDDEPLARRTVRSLLSGFPEIEVSAECSDGAGAVQEIRRVAPDLVFLDVQMPEMNGFEVLEALQPDPLPAVVFVTAYDQYALKAFEVHALDYLLKPFDDQRFEEAVRRALDQIEANHQNILSRKLMAFLGDYQSRRSVSSGAARKSAADRLAIKSQGRISFVAVSDIDWIEAADQYVLIHVNNQSYLIRESMNQMEERLPEDIFFRIHRSSLVNLRRARELRSNKQGECQFILQDGTALKVSRNRRALLHDALTNPDRAAK